MHQFEFEIEKVAFILGHPVEYKSLKIRNSLGPVSGQF